MAVSTLKIVRTGPPSNYVAEPALAVSMRRRMPALTVPSGFAFGRSIRVEPRSTPSLYEGTGFIYF